MSSYTDATPYELFYVLRHSGGTHPSVYEAESLADARRLLANLRKDDGKHGITLVTASIYRVHRTLVQEYTP